MKRNSSHHDTDLLNRAAEGCRILRNELAKVIVGQEAIVEQLLISLFARGHCLLIGVPGLAKTLLISSLARTLDLEFSRIQFTPDLMPSDITGSEILEEDRGSGKKSFKFIRGPVFANVVLADEINRTPPKTQAALLQAMQEYQVSAGGATHALEQPFFVLATQNPIEQEGTYPLPEAQLDRFMFSLWIDYPSLEEERRIIRSTTSAAAAEPRPVLTREDILGFQQLVRAVPVSDIVVNYAVDLVRMTRPGSPSAPGYIRQWIRWGAGPRAAQNLVLGAKARAAVQGRATPEIADINAVAGPVFRHRLVLNFSAEADGISPSDIVTKLLEESAHEH
ncbi:MoxR family ATPase [bacterium]|nr:MoxR family ATPase [bacterium]